MKNIAITENHLYKKTYISGKKAAGKYTVIYVLKDKKAFLLKKQNPQKEYVNRIGLTVSKKLGGAVQRNRAKRVIRAAFAMCEKESPVKKGNLIVIAARDAAVKASSLDVFEEMKKQLKKLGIAYCEDQTIAPVTAQNPQNDEAETHLPEVGTEGLS